LAENFARLRREKGLTQEDVESRSGFSQQYLSGLERGKRNPTIVTLYELAQSIGVSHIDLVRADESADWLQPTPIPFQSSHGLPCVRE
jgi:transcriptional regulator with XRE-family HTH domain